MEAPGDGGKPTIQRRHLGGLQHAPPHGAGQRVQRLLIPGADQVTAAQQLGGLPTGHVQLPDHEAAEAQQAEDLLEQIQDYLGLASLEISSDVLEKSNQMGYKRLKVTPEGTGSSSPGASETILVVGKYLTPELYISYGRSLFSGGNLFFLRYDLSKNWQVESQMGQESGIDLYYKLEFH